MNKLVINNFEEFEQYVGKELGLSFDNVANKQEIPFPSIPDKHSSDSFHKQQK